MPFSKIEPQKNIRKPRYVLSKQERICLRDDFSAMLKRPASIFSHPFKCHYLLKNGDPAQALHRIAIAAPKQHCKRAVDRNRIKRLVREAYRLQKSILYDMPDDVSEKQSKNVDILFIFIGKEIPSYQKVENSIKQLLLQIKERLI